MHIHIVGGIFDKPAAYRSTHSISPETVLAGGLRADGWQVTVSGHHAPLPDRSAELVHVHHFDRAALRVATQPKRVPFVFTTHDPFAMNRLPVGWKRRLTDGLVLKRADRVVALSYRESEFLLRRYGLAVDQVVVIPNGIDATIFDRTAGPERGGELRLLFVGQLQPFKGLDYLLAAMPAIHAAEPRVKLLVVYQTDALLDEYRRAASLGLNGCVEFAGAKTATELAQLYSSAAVVVSPSLGECLSSVVLEAMCCGAAVVATDVGGIREQLDQATGVIVPPRDSAALAQAIIRLLADGDLRSAMGAAARRKARAEFSVRKMIDRHVWLYEELLGADERAA